MPQMLDPAATAYLPIPAAQAPAARPQQPQQAPQPRDPFRQMAGPRVLLLPHADEPVRQARPGTAVRFEAAHAPADTGVVARGQMFTPGQFVPEMPPALPAPPPPAPKPSGPMRTKLKAAYRKKKFGREGASGTSRGRCGGATRSR